MLLLVVLLLRERQGPEGFLEFVNIKSSALVFQKKKMEKELAGCQITYITVIDLLTPDFFCREMY